MGKWGPGLHAKYGNLAAAYNAGPVDWSRAIKIAVMQEPVPTLDHRVCCAETLVDNILRLRGRRSAPDNFKIQCETNGAERTIYVE